MCKKYVRGNAREGKKKKIKRRRREEKPSDHNAGLTSVKEAGKEGSLDRKS